MFLGGCFIMSTVNFKPLGDRILVKTSEKKEEVKGNILIPETAKEKPQEGSVIAVGKGKMDKDGNFIAVEIKVGDTVLYGKYSGTECKLNGEEYMIMGQDDVLGILDC